MFFNIFVIAISMTALALARVRLLEYIKKCRWGSAIFFGFICAVNIANIAFNLDKIVVAHINFSISHRITLVCCIIAALTAITILRTIRDLRRRNDTEEVIIVVTSQ